MLTAFFISYLGEKDHKGQRGDKGDSESSRHSDKKERGTLAKGKGVTACNFFCLYNDVLLLACKWL